MRARGYRGSGDAADARPPAPIPSATMPTEPPNLDLEFAYTTWADSCQDIYNHAYQCRRPHGHDGDHAAGYGTARYTWPQDPPEDWFADWTREDERDGQRRGVLQRIMQWWRAH